MGYLIYFDTIWCDRHQVPASLLIDISEDRKTPEILASFRLLLVACLFAELLGYFFITLGFSSFRPGWVFLLGVLLMMSGGIIGAFFQNKSGTFLSLELQKYLKKLTIYSLEIRSFLADRGCSESEINALQSLPAEVYQSELSGYQRSRILNIGAPLFCGMALLLNGDIITGFIVILLGLSSFPIGEKFFKENTFRRDSELRLGLAAQLPEYVDKTYNAHIWFTAKVNFVSQLPLLLFAIKFIWSGSGQLLSNFFGLTQGLMGLTGTLAFQKARSATMKTTEMTSHLVQALSSSYLIISSKRWEEHCDCINNMDDNNLINSKNGVLLHNFTAHLPFQDKALFSISCFIPAGSVALLRAHSGKGKSTFFAALVHLIENTAELIFVQNHEWINAHALIREEFDGKIFYFREENIDKSARLIDLFKNINFYESEDFLKKAKNVFDPLLVDLAWKAPDNLVEQEIKNIEDQKQSVFSIHMLDFLRELRESQKTNVMRILRASKGNLSTDQIFPERSFATLSSGEKRRIIALIALESCRVIKTFSLVILDEPFTHLDQVNMQHQMEMIVKLQQLASPPAILVVSHHFIEEMRQQISGVQEISI